MAVVGVNYGAYKVILIGDISVGKTSITTRLCKDIFLDIYQNTVAGSFLTHKIRLKDKTYALHIWDTAGQERYRAILPMYLRGAGAAVVVYDITATKSFDQLDYWLDMLVRYAPVDIVVAIVGNKMDMQHKRAITTKRGKDFAETKHHIFYETSAKTGKNIKELFTRIVESLRWRPISEIHENEDVKTITDEKSPPGRRKCCRQT